MENNEFKKVRIKIRTCYCFDEVINLEDFDFNKILIDEKSHENMLIDHIQYKILIDSKPLQIRFFKIGEIIRIYDEVGI